MLRRSSPVINSLESVLYRQASGFLRPNCAPSSEHPQFRMPPIRNAPRASIAARSRATGSITISWRASCCCSSAIAGLAIGANFKMYLVHQFSWNRVKIFLQYTGDTDAKNDGPELWNSNSVIFENFLKFSKRRREVPLRPIWTIMVAAKVDQSRVLVTQFHQNRLKLKGRSAGQTHTHRQTNSAENNGPSGLQSGQ